MESEKGSFLGLLVAKLSYVRRIEAEIGKSTAPLQADVMRQIGQTSPKVGGNIFTGEGVTKSGIHD